MDKDFLYLAEKVRKLSKTQFWKIYKKTKNKRLIVARSFYDLKFFAKFFFSEVLVNSDGTRVRRGHTANSFNDMHETYFKEFEPIEQNVQKVIQAARGSAKTTLLCLIDPMHRVCFSTEKFILILSSTTPLAMEKANTIHTEVSQNKKLRHFFGLDFVYKKTSRGTFELESSFGNCYVHSQGFFSQIRGAKKGFHRPTRILYDDVTHGERVFSEAQREKAERQFYTDIKQASQPGTNHIFLGTTIHRSDLLNKLAANPAWKAYKYKAIKKWPKNGNKWNTWEQIWRDPSLNKYQVEAKARLFYEEHKKEMNEGSEVLWPEREDLYYLMKERMTIGRRAFGSEKQMEPYLTGDSLFQNIQWFSEEKRDGVSGYYVHSSKQFIEKEPNRFQMYYALDPSTGEEKKQTQKKTLSKSARIIASKDLDTGRVYILQAILDRKPPSQIIFEMFDLHNKFDFVRMGIEENLFKDLFRDSMDLAKEKWEKQYGKIPPLPWYGVWASQDKKKRIYSIEPLVASGQILFSKQLNPEYITQLEDYPNCDHNDGLDATEIISKIANPKNKLSAFNFTDIANYSDVS